MQTVVPRPRIFHHSVRFIALLLAFFSLAPLEPICTSANNDTSISDLAGHISRTRLERIVRELSGADSIVIDGALTALTTRFTYSSKKPLAANYLLHELEQAGVATLEGEPLDRLRRVVEVELGGPHVHDGGLDHDGALVPWRLR